MMDWSHYSEVDGSLYSGTSEQRIRFNVPNGDFTIVLTSDKGQPLNKGGSKRVRYSEVPL